ncbi:protein-L-isoaspartate(D-aspartate) O-methyltransferase [bacterium]|nr:protein-L-isoaspartate(D-aspartate) O-methyltransferase [bacterium]
MKRIWILLLPVLFITGLAVTAQNEQPAEPRFHDACMRMVDTQIRARGVTDSLVLAAMERVPRHRFVPKKFISSAYTDQPLPIGHDQTISQPYIVAYMTEALHLKGNEKVLEIGTGSGYQAAVLAEIVDTVYTIEIVESLSLQAQETLHALGYDHVIGRTGDGYAGWPEQAPFDAIIVTAAPAAIPEPLVDQLGENGRMIVPVGTWSQDLILITKKNGKLEQKRLLPVRFVPMTGKAQE